MKLVYVEWADAVHNAEWFTDTQANHWHDGTDWIVRECGWLVKEDKKGITLACRWKQADEYSDPQIGGLQFIPTPWIRKRRDLTKHI